jgi:RNA-splicing ligase RtcB
MKVNEAAHTYGITTKELIGELKAKFPGQKFTANTDLPFGFEQCVQQQAEEYAQASDITLTETPGNMTQAGEDAIVTEAFHYGVLEAIARLRSEDFALDGQVSAIEDIQTFRTSYNEVWTLFHQGEVTQQELRNQGLSQRMEAIAQKKTELGKQLERRKQAQVSVESTQQQLKDKLASLMA